MDNDRSKTIGDSITIDGEDYTKETIEVLIGEKDINELKEDWKPTA